MDRDERVNSDSQGLVQNCTVMKAFDTGEGELLDLCHNDSWVTSLGAPAGWVHGNCPVTCGLCVPNVISGSMRQSKTASKDQVLDSLLSSEDQDATPASSSRRLLMEERAAHSSDHSHPAYCSCGHALTEKMICQDLIPGEM